MLIAVVLAFGAPAAMAQLPGGSAVDQYTENVPGAGGDQPSGGNGGSSDATNGDGTGSSAPATTTPTSPGQSTSGGSQASGGVENGATGDGSQTGGGLAGDQTSTRSGGPPPEVPATLTSQPVPAATDQPGDEGDISAAWPIALLVVALASVGIYWYRRRYPETLIQRPGSTPQRSLV
jgi:hypothetical protein